MSRCERGFNSPNQVRELIARHYGLPDYEIDTVVQHESFPALSSVRQNEQRVFGYWWHTVCEWLATHDHLGEELSSPVQVDASTATRPPLRLSLIHI